MCKVISVISCKGGVGKTTSAVNISAYLQMQGKRVCVVDLNAQHNLSRHFWRLGNPFGGNAYHNGVVPRRH